MDKLLITKTTSLEEIRQEIGKLREQKGKEKETLKLIERGKLLTTLLKQKRFNPVSVEKQILSLYAALNGYLDKFSSNVFLVNDFIDKLFAFASNSYLFAPHIYMLRFTSYFEEFQYSSLGFLLEYYSNYIYKSN